jgi:hypothetical protein
MDQTQIAISEGATAKFAVLKSCFLKGTIREGAILKGLALHELAAVSYPLEAVVGIFGFCVE